MLPYRVICSCSLSSDHLLLVTCQHVVDRRRSSLARIRSHDRDCLIEGITRDASSVTAAPGLEQCYGIGLAVRIPDAVYTSEGTSPGVAVAVALLLVVAIALPPRDPWVPVLSPVRWALSHWTSHHCATQPSTYVSASSGESIVMWSHSRFHGEPLSPQVEISDLSHGMGSTLQSYAISSSLVHVYLMASGMIVLLTATTGAMWLLAE